MEFGLFDGAEDDEQNGGSFVETFALFVMQNFCLF